MMTESEMYLRRREHYKMDKKKFIAYMVLKDGKIIQLDSNEVISDEPVLLAKKYAENNIDEIIINDLSDTDSKHDEAIGIIKKICQTCEIPVIGTGHIYRMEDVKKLLYAGCSKAVIDISNPVQRELLEEVSHKFGKDKMIAYSNEISLYHEFKEKIDALTSIMLFHNEKQMKEILTEASIPVITMVKEMSLDKMLEYLDIFMISGLAGEFVNDNCENITSMKHLCFEKGIPVETFEDAMPFSAFKLNSDGMISVVVQDYKTLEVLMVAYMNEEAYQNTLRTGKMTYYSRSRQELWLKGATSGHFQFVKSLTLDCDNDTLLAKVSQVGAACHTGNYSCFFQNIAQKEYDNTNPMTVFSDVFSVILDRKIHPKEGSYTNYLFDKGIDKILKKLGEEATEIVIAAKNPDPEEIKYEISDFLYHMMVLMAEKNVTWEEITSELARR